MVIFSIHPSLWQMMLNLRFQITECKLLTTFSIICPYHVKYLALTTLFAWQYVRMQRVLHYTGRRRQAGLSQCGDLVGS